MGQLPYELGQTGNRAALIMIAGAFRGAEWRKGQELPLCEGIIHSHHACHLSFKMENKHITTIKDAQKLVKHFADSNGWRDNPNIDKFDHIHEELIEMSKHLRYKSKEERIKYIEENKHIFKDGIGDLFFAVCRLANQLNVDIEDALNHVKKSIFERYAYKKGEKVDKKT